MESKDILIHKINNTLAEMYECELGISLKFTLNLGNSVYSSSTRYYSKDEILEYWRSATDDEIKSYKLIRGD